VALPRLALPCLALSRLVPPCPAPPRDPCGNPVQWSSSPVCPTGSTGSGRSGGPESRLSRPSGGPDPDRAVYALDGPPTVGVGRRFTRGPSTVTRRPTPGATPSTAGSVAPRSAPSAGFDGARLPPRESSIPSSPRCSRDWVVSGGTSTRASPWRSRSCWRSSRCSSLSFVPAVFRTRSTTPPRRHGLATTNTPDRRPRPDHRRRGFPRRRRTTGRARRNRPPVRGVAAGRRRRDAV